MRTKDKSAKVLVFGLFIFAGTCVALTPLSLADQALHNYSPASRSQAQPGMTISIDPESGEMQSRTPEMNLRLPASMSNAMSTSSQGLQEEYSPDDPGKGVKVNLQGRFQSPLIATRNAAGQIVIQHPPAHP